MIDDDMRSEWLQDMADEAKAEEVHDHHMRSDFDFFCDYNQDSIEKLNEAIQELRDQCQMYDYDFDIADFLQ